MKSRFLSFQGNRGPAFLQGALAWSHTVAPIGAPVCFSTTRPLPVRISFYLPLVSIIIPL